MSCLVHCISAQAQTDTSSATKNTGVLSESVRLALFNHPEISEANARVCQAIHRLGLGRAQRRPQVNLTVSGSQQLFDRIRKDDPKHINLVQVYLRPAREFTNVARRIVKQVPSIASLIDLKKKVFMMPPYPCAIT